MYTKRGISHVEMILSFIIFVAAVGFALYFFSPLNSTRLIESSLTYGFREISNNVSISIETFSVVIINEDDVLEKPPHNNVIGIVINGTEKNENLNVRVENLSGNVLPSKIGPGFSREKDTIYVGNISGLGDNEFVFIKLSEDYEPHESPLGNPPIRPYLYEIASWDSDVVISEKRFLALQQSYLINYTGLKKEFNLPNRVNFGFSLVFSGEDAIVAERTIPGGLEVFSEIKRVKVLREIGNIEFADLTFKVW